MTENQDTPAIPAATILLLRDTPSLEVLMIERHRNIAFAGGALVFPGGRIDPGDASDEWLDHATGLREIAADERSFYIAAIREAFEETGVLFAYESAKKLIAGERARALGKWRRSVEADDARFLALIRDEKLMLACDLLQFFAHWMPPQGFHNKRFDTRFFAAIAPKDQTVTPDGGEATEAVWISPDEALAARARGQRNIIFPTARNLELLAVSASAQEAVTSAASRPIRQVQPKMIDRNGEAFLTIPNDLGYPVTEEPLASMRRD